jgi:hypothetical protein
MRSVFFAHNFPATANQRHLIALTEQWMTDRGIVCNVASQFLPSLGSTLTQIRSAIESSQIVIVLAFQRDSDKLLDSGYKQDSPWVHMEAAMAFQLRKPVYLFQQDNLIPIGIFDTAQTEMPIVRFNISTPDATFLRLLDATVIL